MLATHLATVTPDNIYNVAKDLINPLGIKEVFAEVMEEHLESVVVVAELVFVHCHPIFDRGVGEAGKDSGNLTFWLGFIFGEEVLGKFFPFDEHSGRNFPGS